MSLQTHWENILTDNTVEFFDSGLVTIAAGTLKGVTNHVSFSTHVWSALSSNHGIDDDHFDHGCHENQPTIFLVVQLQRL